MNGAVRIAVPNSEKATELIIKNPDIFKDYEVIKGKWMMFYGGYR